MNHLLGITPGVFLVERDRSLWRVVRALQGVILLEDCLKPDEPLRELRARDLRGGGWRTIKPSKEM